MRVVVQRVKGASVRVGGAEMARIPKGLLLLVGFVEEDNEDVLQWMGKKIVSLRVFEDDEGKMNLDVEEVNGRILVVSQFTLYANCNKGKRPSFERSAPADMAEVLYDRFVEVLGERTPVKVETGVFQAHMEVGFINDGPVTLVLDKESA